MSDRPKHPGRRNKKIVEMTREESQKVAREGGAKI